jgi:hypothetical protein
VPIIEKTDVIEDHKENEVVRVAHFIAQEHSPAHEVKEICKSYYPTKVPKNVQSTIAQMMSSLTLLVSVKGRFHPTEWRCYYQHGQ